MNNLIQSNGAAYTKNRTPEQKILPATEAFASNDFFNDTVIPMDFGPYTIQKEALDLISKMTQLKIAYHMPFLDKYANYNNGKFIGISRHKIGVDLNTLLKQSGLFTTDQLSPRPPESQAWTISNHLRLDIPKTQEDEISFQFERMNSPWKI